MDKTWMSLPRYTNEYVNGVTRFIDMAFSRMAKGNQICCPCTKCLLHYWHYRNIVYDHSIVHGFMEGYTEWYFHREESLENTNCNEMSGPDMNDNFDNIDGLLHDTFRNMEDVCNVQPVGEGPNLEAKKFYKLVEEGKQELYSGYKNFSKLSFTIRLYLFKVIHGISDVAITDLLELLKEAFPEANLPKSFSAAKKMVKDLGLSYEKIHCCPNDCVLYWEDDSLANSCRVCKLSRWKPTVHNNEPISDKNSQPSRVPAKVFRFFPLTPKLQRLYMCPELAECMTWHSMKRPKDGNLRHPADGQASKNFDKMHPKFAEDPRNIRLGIASDGFNPFRTMSISHSTWPIVMVNYNLAPWNCTKPEYLMLCGIISGPLSPGKNIDVYMQPVIKELKHLWVHGVETFDASTNQCFQLHVGVLGTMSDFPGLAMLSGYSTKGKLACPNCHYETSSQYLKHSRKFCYMEHRKFLDINHPWRQDKKSFNGEVELKVSPNPLTGTDVLDLLDGFENEFRKAQKKRKTFSDNPWRKKSIFFDLPYWETNSLRHNLDLMHIEKNVFENIVGTLLDIPGKTKDHLKARLDLQHMGIRNELHPVQDENRNQFFLAQACFSMTNDEKTLFCSVLKNEKLPQGCASNISRCVDVNGRKISGYKSHDAHFIMQYLLKYAVRKALPKHVAIVLMKLGDFFKAICSKVIKLDDLKKLQSTIVETVCQLEKKFSPSFFDIMVHLTVHLVHEVELGGHVQYRWMYPIERYLCKLKSYVRNMSKPEGSIAEGYLAEECLNFYSWYMGSGVKTKLNRYHGKNDRVIQSKQSISMFPSVGYGIGRKRKGKAITLEKDTVKIAHRYILFNCEDNNLEKYIEEHKAVIDATSRGSMWFKAQQHSNEFPSWFQKKMLLSNAGVRNDLIWLSKGPNIVGNQYIGYCVNGYKFYTKKRDFKCKTQNSGVSLTALLPSFASSRDQNPTSGDVEYYGIIEDILEIDYWGNFSVLLFRCSWFQPERDEFDMLKVNFKKPCSSNDPFVMANQVKQVFCIQDPIEHEYHYVIEHMPRELFDLVEEGDENAEEYWAEHHNNGRISLNSDTQIHGSCVRADIPSTIVEIPTPLNHNTYGEDIEDHSDFDDTNWDWMVDSG